MSILMGARPGRLLAVAIALSAFVASLSGGVAFAADTNTIPLDDLQVQKLFDQLQAAPVVEASCGFCHGNIANSKNYSSEIIFSHGQHIRMECSSCHSRFPHRKEGTEKPTMKQCYSCHGVRHGPVGILASDKCEDCHVTEVSRLRPAFHTFGWAGKEHVAPAEKEFNTRCAMCHQPASCVECHEREAIEWSPDSWAYNAGDDCLACHENSTLLKRTSGGVDSFRVSGLSDSAHTDVTCQQCHPDYRYDDLKSASPLWEINAGQACADCHAKQEDKRLSDVVDAYKESVHAEKLAEGNSDSATCASCHGGHTIYRTDTDLSKARMHASSYRTCARCKQHGDMFDTYDDYYHGRAYKEGAPDAPACWDCHESHKILPASDKESSVAPANVGDTCGTEGCHTGTGEKFGTAAAELIHEKAQQEQDNPLSRLISRLLGRG